MACAPEWVTAYVDGELDAVARRTLERHLLGCRTCTAQVGAEQGIRLQLRWLRDPRLPRGLEWPFATPRRAWLS